MWNSDHKNSFKVGLWVRIPNWPLSKNASKVNIDIDVATILAISEMNKQKHDKSTILVFYNFEPSPQLEQTNVYLVAQ